MAWVVHRKMLKVVILSEENTWRIKVLASHLHRSRPEPVTPRSALAQDTKYLRRINILALSDKSSSTYRADASKDS